MGADVWLSADFLGPGNVRMLRRTAELLRLRASPPPPPPSIEPCAILPASAHSHAAALAIRSRMYHATRREAALTNWMTKVPPEQTKIAIAQGKVPKPGEGPDAEQSKQTAFHDVAVAYTQVPSAGASTNERAASCHMHAPCSVGHGIGCGYSGSAYCILACALTARAMGGVPADRCGAGLSPCAALDAGRLLLRLKQIGYEFRTVDGAVTAADLGAELKGLAAK